MIQHTGQIVYNTIRINKPIDGGSNNDNSIDLSEIFHRNFSIDIVKK